MLQSQISNHPWNSWHNFPKITYTFLKYQIELKLNEKIKKIKKNKKKYALPSPVKNLSIVWIMGKWTSTIFWSRKPRAKPQKNLRNAGREIFFGRVKQLQFFSVDLTNCFIMASIGIDGAAEERQELRSYRVSHKRHQIA